MCGFRVPASLALTAHRGAARAAGTGFPGVSGASLRSCRLRGLPLRLRRWFRLTKGFPA